MDGCWRIYPILKRRREFTGFSPDSGRLGDLNGNIFLLNPGARCWHSSRKVKTFGNPLHFLECVSKSVFCTFLTASISPTRISLPTVIHSELALRSFQPTATQGQSVGRRGWLVAVAVGRSVANSISPIMTFSRCRAGRQ